MPILQIAWLLDEKVLLMDQISPQYVVIYSVKNFAILTVLWKQIVVIEMTKLVNIFAKSYPIYSYRDATNEEISSRMALGLSVSEAMKIPYEPIATVTNAVEAASYMLKVGADNGLERHIDEALDQSSEYAELRKSMPQTDPTALITYRNSFTQKSLIPADAAIKKYGITLAEGQILFHGGFCNKEIGKTITTSRPFSTSFCPQVALRNAEWNNKAFDIGSINLMVVRVTEPFTKAYILSMDDEKGNEKEVVFASGAKITLINRIFVGQYMICKYSDFRYHKKEIPAYVLEVNIS
ncbi:hypothetical protein ACJRO0_13805 [Acetobacter oryzifermentans]|uniref:hypothetical protein n=1 Tax=Acetobacter oryzifermentans TaxID=1633874 RepID=UPI0039BEE0D0